MNLCSDLTTSRFFLKSDTYSRHFFFDLPNRWWSRFYEYPWASQFVNSDDIVLDAACGISHPLKFKLSEVCKNVYACDLDKRITQPNLILQDIQKEYNIAIRDIPSNVIMSINYEYANVTSLPYKNKFFTKIFCISVLEHLKDSINTANNVKKAWKWRFFKRKEILNSLKEFRRVLSDEGLIVLTFDFPRINLDYLQLAIYEAGLQFAGKIDFRIPNNSVYSPENKLYCFRAVLKPIKK